MPPRILLPNVLFDRLGLVLYIAVVLEKNGIAAGGYYNCSLAQIDPEKWETTDYPLKEKGEYVVLNLVEIPRPGDTDTHNLDVGNLIICWNVEDSTGIARFVGVEVAGRHTAGEWAP